LNGILGYAQILRRDKHLTTKQADGLNIIQQSGEHLLMLINDILDLAKIEAGKMELNPSPVYLALFLESIIQVIQMRADQKGIALLYEPLTSLEINVNVDEKRLRQILLNLLINAVKFTDRGMVTLRIAHLNELETPGVAHKMAHLRFEVVDTGVGMTPEQLSQIFNPFVQVGDTRRQVEGTGLGLAITRQLIEAMGSELQVKSDYGQGTTFWFDISLSVSNTLAQKDEVEQPISGYKGRRRKILVVDDKSSNRAVFTTMLEPLGFELYVAENGQQAIEQAQTIRPDLILMDMIMPIMTWFEATQTIRNTPNLKQIVIIGASASTFEKDIQQVKLAGCDSFLPKPIEFRKLLTLLEFYLNLEWNYDEVEVPTLESKIINKPTSETNSLAIPPQTVLQQLYKLAMMGDLLSVEEEALKLQTMNINYTAFIEQICRMTADFQVEPVINFIKVYLEGVADE
jgi:CheY-like chemotaxis protein